MHERDTFKKEDISLDSFNIFSALTLQPVVELVDSALPSLIVYLSLCVTGS
jgi:hypothetical protein